MPDIPQDVMRFSEANRRWLYEQVAEMQFSPSEVRGTPDQGKLQVIFFAGRWFATWLDLDEPPALPIEQRFRIARISVRSGQTDGVELYEV